MSLTTEDRLTTGAHFENFPFLLHDFSSVSLGEALKMADDPGSLEGQNPFKRRRRSGRIANNKRLKTSQPSSFVNFPRLPPEIRNQIWELALPPDIENVMYTTLVRKHWRRRAPRPGEPTFINFPPAICPQPLLPLEMRLPMAFASREAYSISQHWLQRNGFVRDHNAFVRPFVPDRDPVLVPITRFPHDILRLPIGGVRPWSLSRVAFTEHVLRNDDKVLFFWLFITMLTASRKEVLIIVHPPTELHEAKRDPLPVHWDFTPLPGGTLRWNADRQCVEPVSIDAQEYPIQAYLTRSLRGMAQYFQQRRPTVLASMQCDFQLVTATQREVESY